MRKLELMFNVADEARELKINKAVAVDWARMKIERAKIEPRYLEFQYCTRGVYISRKRSIIRFCCSRNRITIIF